MANIRAEIAEDLRYGWDIKCVACGRIYIRTFEQGLPDDPIECKCGTILLMIDEKPVGKENEQGSK